MARAKTNYGWRATYWSLQFSFSETDRAKLKRLNLSDDDINLLEEFTKDFVTDKDFDKTIPTNSEVFETLRCGLVEHKKGELAFARWLRICDSRTRQYLQINSKLLTDSFSVPYEQFPQIALRTKKHVPTKNRGPRLTSSVYRLSRRVAYLLKAGNKTVKSYDPMEADRALKVPGKRGGGLFSQVMRIILRSGGHEITRNLPKIVKHGTSYSKKLDLGN